MLDYLIVGQGLAGSLLAWELLQRGGSFQVVDPNPEVNASKVAAGIFNPITGKRCVRTWGDTRLLPYAKTFYEGFEQQTGLKVRFPMPILRIFKDMEEVQRVLDQTRSDPQFAAYVKAIWSPEEMYKGLKAPSGAVELNGGGYVDTGTMLTHIRTRLENAGRVISASLHYDELSIQGDHVIWQDQAYRHLVFCEGHRASRNPWFNAIPYRHAKGEILTLNIPELELDHIINCSLFMLSLGAHRYKVGATYEWEDFSEEPTDKGRDEILERLRGFCELPWTIEDHQGAVRPIAFDRAPVAGRHPEIPCLSLLNGFGSKGVLYGPYYSRMLIDHLEKDEPIEDKVSIQAHWRPERNTDEPG